MSTTTARRLVDPRRWTTGTRFAVVLVVAALAPMGVIAWAGVATGRSAVERSQLASVEATAQFSAATLGEYLVGVTSQADQLATQPEVVAALGGGPAATGALDAVLAANSDIASVALIGRDGVAVEARPSAAVASRDFADGAWFQRAMGGSPALSDVTSGSERSGLSLLVAVPARPAGSAAVGVVALEVRLDPLLWVVNRAPQSPGSQLLLVNEETVVVGARDHRLRFVALGEVSQAEGVALAAQRGYPVQRIEAFGVPALGQAMPDGEGTITRAALPGRGEQILAYDRVEGHDLWIVVAEPRSTFLAPIDRLADQILVACIVIGVVAVAAAIFMARRVSRPITALTQAAAAVERDEEADLAALERYGQGHSDLSRLARVMGRMAREVVERERRLRAQVKALRVEIDHERRAKDVAEVVESDFFRDLESRAADMRRRAKGTPAQPATTDDDGGTS